MSFNPTDFYYLASLLHEQENKEYPESYTRATISRAYYSAFLVARDKAGITKSTSSIHQEVHSHYTKIGKTKIAHNLDDLRTKRNDADYDLNKNMTSRDSGIALRLAKQILEGLNIDLTKTTH